MADKILYIVSSLRKSGPIVVLKNIVSHLDPKRFHVEIVKLSTDEVARSITDEFRLMGIAVHELNFTKLQLELRPEKAAKEIDRIIKEKKFKIIHTHGYQAVCVASRLKERVARIETLHCISGEDFRSSKGLLMGMYMNYRYCRNLQRFDMCAAISKSVKSYMSARIPQVSIAVIPNGVTDVVKPDESKIELRKKLGLPPDGFIFVVVGALSMRKDPFSPIQAFKKAFPKECGLRCELIFIGKGKQKEKCEALIGDDSRIKLLGWRENAYDYLWAADWSISASHSEGFGLNFMESLIVGTPIVSTRIAAFDEFMPIFPELENYRFNAGDVEELASKLKQTVASRIDKECLISGATNHFSSLSMAQKYMDVYSRLLNMT